VKQRLYAPGPVELPPEVLAALARPVLHHRTPEYLELQQRVGERLTDVFMVPGHEVLTLSGSGSTAMEAAFINCVPVGAEVLVINGGKFGERWLRIAEAYRHPVVELAVEWGQAADPAELTALLRKHPATAAVLATHSETSTGVLHDIEALSRAAREAAPDSLFIVDAVTSLAAAELTPLAWDLDAVVSGSQKGLLTPPGLGFVWLSPRAWASSRDLHPRFTLDLRKRQGGRQPTTPATSLMVALDVALELLLAEGLEQVISRRTRLNEQLLQGAEELGYRRFAERVSPAVAALTVPAGVSARALVKHLAQRGLVIGGGQDQLADTVIRPSLLGHADDYDVGLLLAALHEALKALAQS